VGLSAGLPPFVTFVAFCSSLEGMRPFACSCLAG
jgi:hypothetical protein